MRLFAALFIVSLSLGSCSTYHKVLKAVGLSGPKKNSSFAKLMKSSDYDLKLRMADKYYIEKNYNKAQQLYDDLFRVLKGTDHFEHIYYNFAYCSFYLKDYLNAENLFKGFTEAFPNSQQAEEMEYMRAFTFYKQSPKWELDQTNTTKTIGFMQAFINTHPGSARTKDASDIIEKCHAKLELKEYKNAELYFNIQQPRAAVISLNNLMNNYPDSPKSEDYKLMAIKAYYMLAGMSIETKKEERYEQVITACNEFTDRFPDSKLTKEVKQYLTQSQNNLKTIKNEQDKKAG